MLLNLMKILIPATVAFALGIFITPLATHYFYKYKMWKKRIRTETASSSEFSKIHKAKEASEVSTPCVGGIIIWVSILVTVLLFYLLPFLFPNSVFLTELSNRIFSLCFFLSSEAYSQFFPWRCSASLLSPDRISGGVFCCFFSRQKR